MFHIVTVQLGRDEIALIFFFLSETLVDVQMITK